MTEVSEQPTATDSGESRGWIARHPRLCVTGAMVLLMAVGAGLRFYHIERPALWSDEVATYQRVLGSFSRVMKRLQVEGFTPLHYICTWALGQWTLLTPLMMRLVPAVTGVLFIPAVYLLGRQLFDRRTSLAAAVMATVGAYGLIYSRDAKMYMQTWLFVTLFMGLLLLWWRTGRWWVWPLWVVCGAIAVMFHATAMIVVALCPLFLAVGPARKRKVWRWGVMVVLAVVGLAAVMTPPVVYYLRYNVYVEKTGIAPVETDGKEAPDWEASGLGWIPKFNRGVGPWELTANSAANYLMGVQWPRDTIDPQGSNGPMPGWFAPAVAWGMTVLVGLMVVGALPWKGKSKLEIRNSKETRKPKIKKESGASDIGISNFELDSHVEFRTSYFAWWRCVALLGAWLILPTYGVFYCRSFANPAGPWAVGAAVWGWLGWWWLVVAMASFWLILYSLRWRLLGWITGIVFVLLLGGTLAAAMIGGGGRWGAPWTAMLGNNAWLLAIMVSMGAAVWYQWGGESARDRNLRMLIGGGLMVGLFVICWGAWWVWQLMAEAYRASHDGQIWQSIWMPRYLGIVYPAVLLTAAGLFMRLPTRWLGWAAVAICAGINLTQGIARVVVRTEPPFALAAADAWRSHQDAKVGLVFDAFNEPIPGAFLCDGRMEYYLNMAAGKSESSVDFNERTMLHSIRRLRDPWSWQLRRYVRRIDTLIVWQRFDYDRPRPTDPGVYKTLEPDWKMVSCEIYRTHQFWTWRIGNWYRRMIYERQTAATK